MQQYQDDVTIDEGDDPRDVSKTPLTRDEVRARIVTHWQALTNASAAAVRGSVYAIAVVMEKGGVGKTSITTHLAAALAMGGLRVVVIDCDAQANATTRLGVKESGGLYDLLIRDGEWERCLASVKPERFAPDALIDGGALVNHGELYIVPGNIETRAIPVSNPDPLLIKARLEELDGWADVVLFDTSPTPSLFHAQVYVAAHSVIIPTNPTLLSLQGMAKSIVHQNQANTARTNGGMQPLHRLGIVPTMIEDTTAHDEGIKQMRAKHRREMLPGLPKRAVWQKAEWEGLSLYRFAPQDVATMEMIALAARVAGTLPLMDAAADGHAGVNRG